MKKRFAICSTIVLLLLLSACGAPQTLDFSYAPVNEHGQLYRPAFCDKTGKYYERHPVTGTEITGFQIPLFDQALELCRTASRRVEAHLKYIGWDVALLKQPGNS